MILRVARGARRSAGGHVHQRERTAEGWDVDRRRGEVRGRAAVRRARDPVVVHYGVSRGVRDDVGRDTGGVARGGRGCRRGTRGRGPADGQRVAEDQHGTERIGNDTDGRIGRNRRGTGRERERIGAGDRDHLVQDGWQRHTVDIAQRRVVGVIEPWLGGRGECRRGARGTRAARSPQRSAKLARRRDRSDAQLAEPVQLVLERDNDLGILLVGCVFAGEGLDSTEGEGRCDHAVDLAGTYRVVHVGVVPNVLQAVVDRLAGGQGIGRGTQGGGGGGRGRRRGGGRCRGRCRCRCRGRGRGR